MSIVFIYFYFSFSYFSTLLKFKRKYEIIFWQLAIFFFLMDLVNYNNLGF